MKNHADTRNRQHAESKFQSRPKTTHRRPLSSLLATAAVILTAISLANCAAYTSASSTTPTPGAGVLAASATTLTFGSVAMGTNAMQTLSITNTGTGAVNITQATISGSGFTLASGSGAATLAVGQSATMQIQFTAASAAAATGSLVVSSNASNPTLTIALRSSGAQPGLTVTPASVSFGNVAVGTTATQTITLKNTGTVNLTVSSATATGAGFSVTGFAAQTVGAGGTMTFNATFTPASTGSVSGSISVVTDASSSPTPISLSGTGTQPGLSVTPSSVSFGNVAAGTTATQAITLKNTGTANLVVSSETLTGARFSVTGFVAQTLAPNSSMSFDTVFAPTGGGSSSGSISVSTSLSGSPTVITLTGAGTQPGISVTPSSVSFGTVADGTTGTQAITVKNTGTANLVVSSESVTGAGFSVTGFTAQTLTPNSSMSFDAVFAPTSAGSASGGILISTNLSGPTTISLAGTGAQPAMSLTPSSVTFGSVVDGTNNSQTITLQNTGTVNLVVSSESVTGTGFSVTGFTAQTLAPNGSMTFNAAFAPTSAGSVTGSISVNTNIPGSPTAISLSGTGAAATHVLGASPTTLSFGSVNLGGNSSLTSTLTNNGNSNITISGISGAAGAFSTSGISAGTVLTPSQSATLHVTFTPTTSGAASATITISSNSTTTPSISVSGTGAATSSSVNLSWNPSSSSDVVGYNVYRGTISGGPYSKITPSPVGSTLDTDSTVSSGQTYYYVVTALDSSNNESADSNQAVVAIP
ncbi:MAG: choice-of-anchor D domain-containing protein [Candidatus Acidiferrales bacterium]